MIELALYPLALLAAVPGLAFLPAALLALWVRRRWSGFGPGRKFLAVTGLATWFLYAPYETYMYFWMRTVIAPIRVDLLLAAPLLYAATLVLAAVCLWPPRTPAPQPD